MSYDEWNEETCLAYTESMRKNVKYDHRPWAKRIASHLRGLPKNATVVDLATGPGFLLFELAKLLPTPRLVAVDAAEPMLNIAAEQAEQLELVLMTLMCPTEALDIKENSVDVLTCKQLLHEAGDVDCTLKEMARVLKPGCRAFVIDFDAESLKLGPIVLRTFIRLTGGRDIARAFWHSYSQGLKGSEIPTRMRAAGFS
ncbi:MAG: methyltransferase domain-containing protein, partial [Proteobacteria bacterium]|nr:methyltransferase domain-containing protein [Pseudomonadota bacterium]